MRGNAHVRFGGREKGNGAGVTQPPRPFPTLLRKLPPTAAEDLLELVMRRYERVSTIITTNKGIREWPEILAGDEVLATAILDRLLHNSHVLDVKGRSYRLRDLERAVSQEA